MWVINIRDMKIAITVSSLAPGSGLSQYVYALERILTSADNQIYVITTHSNDPYYEKTILQRYGHVEYYSLGVYSKFAKYLNIAKLFFSISPDIIINNYNAVVQYILPILPRKIRVVHVLHNNTKDFYRVGAINGWRVDGWVAPTQAIARYFNDYTVQKYSQRMVIIPHGVESVANISVKVNEILKLIFVGVLYEHKGVKLLPPIIKKLKADGINFRFTIVGKGELKQFLMKELDEEIRNGQVEMTGVIPSEEVYKRLSDSDIFVYPTYIDAFGLVIAEAMMNATVPIVTNLIGITDNLIDNGVNGFLIRKDNVEEFVSSIKTLANNRNLLEKLKEESFDKAACCFSLSQMKYNYINYINKIVSL